MNKSVKIETATALFFFEGEILNIVFKQDADVKLEDVKENIEIRKQMQEGSKVLVLGDIRGILQISSEARAFVSSKQVANLNIAMAIITDSLTTKLLANFFIKFNKPQSPTKLFNDKQSALVWLSSIDN